MDAKQLFFAEPQQKAVWINLIQDELP